MDLEQLLSSPLMEWSNGSEDEPEIDSLLLVASDDFEDSSNTQHNAPPPNSTYPEPTPVHTVTSSTYQRLPTSNASRFAPPKSDAEIQRMQEGHSKENKTGQKVLY